jgi:hypothetical protein
MVDIKFFKPVSATFSGTATDPGGFPPPSAPGAPVGVRVSTSGVLYTAQIASDGSVEVSLITDNTAAPSPPIGIMTAGIFRTTLPTYSNGDGTLFHMDNRGRLLVSTGESSLTADIETDQDPAPAFPIGNFVVMKYEAALPAYTAGDAATLHSDSIGRLMVTEVDPTNNTVATIRTEDDAAPTNPTGAFNLSVYRAVLPVYTDGDASIIHTDSRGRMAVTVGASTAAMTAHFDSDGDNTAQVIKASAGILYNLHIINSNGANTYVQLFDVDAGSVTVGTTTPDYVIFVPGGAATITDFNNVGLNFSTAITYACTTTPTGSGDPTTGLTVSGGYA